MTLLERRFRLLWVRYVAPGALERDPRFRGLLRRLTHQGLQVVGLVTALGAVAYTVYRLLSGDVGTWNEADGVGGSVQLWDKALLVGLGGLLAMAGRLRIGLRLGRTAVAAFVGVVAWFVVLGNFEAGNFNLSASWLTLMMVVAMGAVPLRPPQVAGLGLLMVAEFWYFADVTPGLGGDVPRLGFLLLATAAVTIVAAALYASRYQQYRALRRIARLRDFSAARSAALERALQRERAMQDQLVQQEKLASLGQLTAGIAHEIKNPLNFVNNFAGLSKDLAVEVREALLEDPERPAKAVVEALGEALDDLVLNTEKIAEHGWRADGIVKSMLAHSRTTPGERQPADLNKLLDEYVGLAYHGMRARHALDVEVERDYDARLEPIPLVREELGRVFLNLLGNAFDALRACAAEAGPEYRPRLRVTTRRTDDGAVVYIADNAGGMPPEVAARVFEPFFTTKPSGEGTGLGLSLAYEIVTQGHGGALDVRSREGEGTVFSVTLPAEIPPAASAPAASAPAAVGLDEDRENVAM